MNKYKSTKRVMRARNKYQMKVNCHRIKSITPISIKFIIKWIFSVRFNGQLQGLK